MKTLLLNGIKIHVGIERAIELAKKFVLEYPNGKGLYLFGSPGVGKTMLAKAIAETLDVDIVNIPSFLESLRDEIDINRRLRADAQRCYGSSGGDCGARLYGAEGNEVCEVCLGDYGGIVDDLKLRDLLILDDIGSEKVTEWALERLYLIIDYRSSNELPLIITSNLEPEELAQHFHHDRLVSRILGLTTPVEMTGEDYRIKGIQGLITRERKLKVVSV